jgi:hypothetical protein
VHDVIDPERIRPYLEGITYPVTASDLIEHVRSKRPPEDVKRAVEAMPPGEWHREDTLLEDFRQAQEARERRRG